MKASVTKLETPVEKVAGSALSHQQAEIFGKVLFLQGVSKAILLMGLVSILSV